MSNNNNTGKHTPGPWRVSASTTVREVDARAWEIADCTGAVQQSLEEASANARLIAAAPELLAACKAFTSVYLPDLDVELGKGPIAEAIRAMLAAIAKAEGSK